MEEGGEVGGGEMGGGDDGPSTITLPMLTSIPPSWGDTAPPDSGSTDNALAVPVPMPKEKKGDFDPEAFIKENEGSLSSDSFDQKFLKKYGDDTDFVPDSTQVLTENFKPEKFIKDYEGTSEAPPESIIEQAKAGAEAFSQGFLSDLSKVAEVKSGLSTLPAIEQRELDYPNTHAAAKIAGLMTSWMGGPAEKMATLTGSRILGNILSATAYAGGDNISKAMLGRPGGDTPTAVASSLVTGGITGLMNAATEGLFSAAGSAYKAMPQTAQKAMQWLAQKPISKTIGAATIASGIHAYATREIPSFIATEMGLGLAYESVKKRLNPVIQKALGNLIPASDKYVGDALLYAMEKTNFFGIPPAIAYAQRVTSGLNALADPIEALFKSGAQVATEPVKEKISNQIRQWVSSGGAINELKSPPMGGAGATNVFKRNMPQRRPTFADGGDVESNEMGLVPQKPTDHFAEMYPTENILLNETKARVSNYLNSIRPLPNNTKAPFDVNTPQTEKEKSYSKAIEIAANPIGILKHVNNGTLTPELLTHFKSMYPEVHDLFSKKITERIVKAQLKEERPPYHKTQSMSLFLGAPLDSSLNQQAIATIQAIYGMNKIAQQQQQAPQKKKRGTAPLSKAADPYLTNSQAREQRQQNSKS